MTKQKKRVTVVSIGTVVAIAIVLRPQLWWLDVIAGIAAAFVAYEFRACVPAVSNTSRHVWRWMVDYGPATLRFMTIGRNPFETWAFVCAMVGVYVGIRYFPDSVFAATVRLFQEGSGWATPAALGCWAIVIWLAENIGRAFSFVGALVSYFLFKQSWLLFEDRFGTTVTFSPQYVRAGMGESTELKPEADVTRSMALLLIIIGIIPVSVYVVCIFVTELLKLAGVQIGRAARFFGRQCVRIFQAMRRSSRLACGLSCVIGTGITHALTIAHAHDEFERAVVISSGGMIAAAIGLTLWKLSRFAWGRSPSTS